MEDPAFVASRIIAHTRIAQDPQLWRARPKTAVVDLASL